MCPSQELDRKGQRFYFGWALGTTCVAILTGKERRELYIVHDVLSKKAKALVSCTGTKN